MSKQGDDRRLPTETFCRIFHLVSAGGLAVMCAASRRTRMIAEPILYTNPRAECPVQVLLLVRTLLGRAELLRHARSLTFNLDGTEGGDGLGPRYFASLLYKIQSVLDRDELSELRELVWCARGDTGWALPISLDSLPHIARFSTTATTPSLVPFLTAHPSITRLTLHSHGLALRLPPYALPNLTHLACAAPALSGLPVRKLKHVVLMDAPFIPLLGGGVLSVLGVDRDRSSPDFTRGWRDASPVPLQPESDLPLRSITLRLGHVIISPSQAPLILEPFVRHVPSLKRLGIVAGPSFFTREVLESLTPTLEGFTELRCIQLECNADPDGSGYRSPPIQIGEGNSPTTEAAEIGQVWRTPTANETESIVESWKTACPSLDNVGLPWQVTGVGKNA